MTNQRPLATISLIVASFVVTLMAPAFDSSVYGINGHPTVWLSFIPDSPFRHFGIGLIVSPFIHLSIQHLLINMALLMPVALMIERKKSATFLVGRFMLIHFIVLVLLVAVNSGFPLNGKAFLGSSHIIMGLYTYWALKNKKYGMLFFPILVLSIGIWQSQNFLVLLSHALGAVSAFLILLLGRVRSKFRSHPSN